MNRLLPIIGWIKRNPFPLFLVGLIALICVLNYTPGTWLSGWDTLHPEFNFPLNLQRIIFGVWREDQGLGAVAAHSHMSELPRIIFLWISSLILPLSFLRYFYIFLCLILGPLGVYFLLKKTVFNHKEKTASDIFPFIGGLFYLLNLGTLQHFYIPFEMFPAQYAALPWLFLFALKYLETGRKKIAAWFILISFLASPQAYAATLFYAYVLALIGFLAVYLIGNFARKKKGVFVRILLLGLFTFIANAYWILPNIYQIKTVAWKVPLAKTNELFSEEAFLKNKKFGILEDTALFQGYLFDWTKLENNQTVPLFNKWTSHINNPTVIFVGYLAFIIILWGIFNSFFKPNRWGLYMIPIFLVPYFFLVGMNGIYGTIYELFQNHFALFKEALRMPWTKFSILLIFSCSIFFSLGNYYIYLEFKKKFKKAHLFFLGFWTIALIWYCLPFFQGELVGSFLRIKIPDEYFQSFKWLNEQNIVGRIANFPSSSYAGWEVYDWGYQGSGFFWFGEKFPYLARDFDRWDPANENYYHEALQTLYKSDKEGFEKLLQKYQITYLILDSSIVSQTSNKDYFYWDQLQQMIGSIPSISLAKKVGSLSIYYVQNQNGLNTYISLGSGLPNVNPPYFWNNNDQAFKDIGDYETLPTGEQNSSTGIWYPFRSLFSGKNQDDIEFKVTEDNNSFSFIGNIPTSLINGLLEIPSLDSGKISNYDIANLQPLQDQYPQLTLDNEYITYNPDLYTPTTIPLTYINSGVLEAQIPKSSGLYSFESDGSNTLDPNLVFVCDQKNGKIESKKVMEGDKENLQLTSLDATSCLDISLTSLTQKTGYIVAVESKNITGESLLMSFINKSSQRAEVETYLPKINSYHTSYFVIPPSEEFGKGYSLFFKNISAGFDPTINSIKRISLYPLPYDFLTSIKVINNSQGIINTGSLSSKGITVDHPNQSYYKIGIINNIDNQTLILSQSFNDGWKAYQVECTMSNLPRRQAGAQCAMKEFLPFLFGKEIKDHVLVNNWENGWKLGNGQCTMGNEQCTIVIYYLPQVLEFIGFGLLPLPFIGLFLYRKKKVNA